MSDEKIITSSVFEQGITEIMQDIANNLYEFEEYTEEEVANLIDLSEEEVAELTRVINDTTVALNKVYSNKKVEDLLSELEVTCNKYADEKIGGLAGIHLAYVDALPTTGEDNVVYILKSTTGGNDTLNLYNNGWISIGEFAVSLDNYYDKAEVDALLNDKANANEVISQNDVVSDMSNVSSSTVLSTAGLEVELNKKVDKDSITKVLDNTVTNEQVASAKAVYDTTVDKNIKTYTMLEQIGLASGTTVSEIFLTMPDNSMVEIGTIPSSNAKEGFYCIDDLPDSTASGILTVIKYNYARFNIIFKKSASGEIATNDIWIGNLKGSDGTGLTWSKLVLEETHNMSSYYALKQLRLDSTATINQVLTNMVLGSTFVCQISEFDDLTQFPTKDTTMTVYLVKYSMARVLAMCYDKMGNYYVGLISSSNTLTGWKKISMITDLNHLIKKVTLTATAGTWTRIAKFTGNSAVVCKGAGNNSINVILKRAYGNNNTEYLDFDYIGMYDTKKFVVNKQFSDAKTFKTLRYTYDSANNCGYIEVWRGSSSTNDTVIILNNIVCVNGSWEAVNKDTTESLTVLAHLDLSTANKDKTAISYSDSAVLVNSSASFYTVRNGICYVSLYMNLARAISSSLTVGALPSPVIPQYHVVSTYSGTVYNEANLIVSLDSDGNLKISGGTFNSSVNGSGYYAVSFSYPVKE